MSFVSSVRCSVSGSAHHRFVQAGKQYNRMSSWDASVNTSENVKICSLKGANGNSMASVHHPSTKFSTAVLVLAFVVFCDHPGSSASCSHV